MKLWKEVAQIYESITHFVFPFNCVACQEPLPDRYTLICPFCEGDFNYTYFEHFEEETSLDKLFFGRVPLEFTYGLLYFEKGSNTQSLIHAIKYKNNKLLAHEMGKRIGERLNIIKLESKPDVLISVPLHAKKEFMRGYNQGTLIALGLAESTKIPFNGQLLKRSVFTETQTKKGKYERWSNVETVFEVKNPEKWKGKHICIVDDVITTGSTLEACIRVLQESIPEVKVSVVALAVTK
jgi:competence protein ComFC